MSVDLKQGDITAVVPKHPPPPGPPDDRHELEPLEFPEEAAGPRVSPYLTTLAAAASAAAASWMVADMFRDFLAHGVALLGVGIGAGMVLLGHRLRRPGLFPALTLAVAGLVGAALVAPDATGGSATVPGLVTDALKGGGFLQPPVPFDPGWRLVLVLLFAMLTSGSALLAIALGRPKIGVLIPAPLIVGAGLLQPAATEVVAGAVAVVLVVVALAVAYGAELGENAELSSAFEARRLLRGVAVAVGVGAVVFALSYAGVLFPQPDRERIIPPQRPQVPQSEPDRVIFRYTSSAPVPLRLGVIDTYDAAQGAWLLPPYDAKLLRPIQPPSWIPGATKPRKGDITATFTIADVRGHGLPSIAGVDAIKGAHVRLEYDPRAQTIRLADRPAFNGLTYTVTAPAAPTRDEKVKAGKPPSSVSAFLVIPPPPNEVVTSLRAYSQLAVQQNAAENAFDRLQFLRQSLYDKVVAAGAGNPVDVSPSRVGEMMRGANASPYEITAAEAMLARWAGVPSRIGFGYYGGTKNKDGVYEIRPKDGTTFLEVYFDKHGWLPIVGVPPKAKPSTSTQQKNDRPNIRQSDELQLIVYVVVNYPTILLLYEYVRYFLVQSAPFLLLVAAALIGYPWLLKLLRTGLRRRWARKIGPKAVIGVLYAEFRDRCHDLTIGDPAAHPAEFLECLDSDPEHQEFAWLVERAIWGDLRRDLRTEDVEAAYRLAASLQRRLSRGQPFLSRMLAAVARTSLKEPALRRTSLAGALGAASALLISCGQPAAAAPRPLSTSLVPPQIAELHFDRSAKAEAAFKQKKDGKLVTAGLVYLVEHDDIIEGSVQISLFSPEVQTGDMVDNQTDFCVQNPDSCPGHEVFKGIQRSLGGGRFDRIYRDSERAYVMQLPAQRIYIWFPPRTDTVVMLILRKQFTAAASDGVFQGLVDYQHGLTPSPVPIPPPVFATENPNPGSNIDITSASPSPSGSPEPSPGASSSPSTNPSP